MSVGQPQVWQVGSARSVALDRPRLIAILNLTPDSFFDGGRQTTVSSAIEAAERSLAEGADALDLGGESTRPGASRISADEQISRVIPVLKAIRSQSGPLSAIPISIDTTLAPVAQAALDAGADAINDVSAGLEDPSILTVAAAHGAGLILMHRLVPPGQDSYSDRYANPPEYGDVVRETREFLSQRAEAAIAAGVDRRSIVIDPGLGFGKTVEQNLELIRRTGDIAVLGFPVLSGVSRKSFVGRAAGQGDSGPGERLEGTLALSVAHLAAGARLFRVHDVAAHERALTAAWAVWGPAGEGRGGIGKPSPGPVR
jgi:dihydropteroate synthase